MDGETMVARKALIGAATSVVLLIIASLLSACGRGGAPSAIPTQNVSPGGYALTLLDGFGNTIPDDGRIALTVEESSGGIIAAAFLREDGLPLGADLYAELSYPANVHPVKFSVGGAFGDAERSISLAVLNRQPLPVGVSLISPSRDETVPAGGLFTVEFARGGLSSPRAVSGAPTGDGNVLHDRDIAIVLDGLNVDFEWKERNCGDYDRDGVVGIADITPIAIHYGKQNGDDPDVVDLVDGSGNGEVDIADITPIAMNYADVIEGYRIWRSDLMGGQYLPEPGNPLSDVSASRPDEGAAPPGRVVYTFSDIAPDDTVYYIFYPYGDGETGAASDEIHPFTRDTVPPVWVSDVGIISAEMDGLTSISFSFGQAVDADSPPVKYRLYWQEGAGPMDFGSASVKVYEVGDGELTPYTRILSDGIVEEQVYSLCVRAFDDLGNETTNVNYLSAGGGSPDDTTPPEWVSEVGIISAVPGDAQVTVTWGEATDAESEPVTYLLFVAEAAEGVDWETPYNTYSAGTLSTVVDSLDNGTQYEFGVRARDSSVNQNTTTNTDTLTATPVGGAGMPWGTPLIGLAEFIDIPVNDVSIVVDGVGHPLIATVNKSEGGIHVHYYDEGTSGWVHNEVAPSHRYYHPDMVIIGSFVYLVAFDGDTGQLMLFVGNDTVDDWQSELVDGPYENCYSASIDYSPVTGEIGIAAVFGEDDPPGPEDPPNEELWYYHAPLAHAIWPSELVDNSEPNISYANMNMHPVTGHPAIAYGRGVLVYSIADPINEARLAFATYDPVLEWQIEDLPDNRYTQSVDFAFDPQTNEPVISFSESVVVDFGGQDVPVTNASVFTQVESEWYYNLLADGDAYAEGATIVQENQGNDPDIEFALDGKAATVHTFVQAVYDIMGDSWTIYTQNQLAERVGGWTTPLPLTSKDYGSMTPALAYNGSIVQVAFNALGIRTDALEFTVRNDYAEGYLAYYRE